MSASILSSSLSRSRASHHRRKKRHRHKQHGSSSKIEFDKPFQNSSVISPALEDLVVFFSSLRISSKDLNHYLSNPKNRSCLFKCMKYQSVSNRKKGNTAPRNSSARACASKSSSSKKGKISLQFIDLSFLENLTLLL